MGAEAGIEGNVAFHPFTKEPMYVYEAIDCVVVSSLMEGLPNVLLEGLAMKKACVSTNIAGCPECVLDGVDGVAKLGEAGCDFVNAKMDKNTQFWDFKKLF